MLLRSSLSCFKFSTNSNPIKITIGPQKTYLLDDLIKTIPTQVTITREDVLKHYRQLSTMRQLQLTCDKLYKAKFIRGFCHLYSGQEAVAQGIDSALTFDDPLISAYRIHCQAYKRGISVREIIAEMLGKFTGSTKGKGGSMHYYKKSTNFYGGNGIVGAQIPVGTGLAFALKYEKKKNVAAVMFGDGASNQGQLYEAMNMAKLWNLPVMYICENNIYGMGTSIDRSSMNPYIYTRGDKIPGIRIDGNNVFEVKQIVRWWPIFLELMTYRYSGHSMSDPGTTYRTRDQVRKNRQERDPLLILEKIGLTNNLVTKQELQKIQQEQYQKVTEQAELAKSDPENKMQQLVTHVYADNSKHYIRGKLYDESIIPAGQKY